MSAAARVLIEGDPFAGKVEPNLWDGHPWPGSWVLPAGLDAQAKPWVVAFRRCFELTEAKSFCVHVSADERYELFLNGQRVGNGPQRGDWLHWHFETYSLELDAGRHMLVARVWALGQADHLAPTAQMSVKPGFLLAAESDDAGLLSTGRAAWEGKELAGTTFLAPEMRQAGWFCGANEKVDGSAFPWGFECGEGEGWGPVRSVEEAHCTGWPYSHRFERHVLRPASLPAMQDVENRGGVVRHAEVLPASVEDVRMWPVDSAKHESQDGAAWQRAFDSDSAVEVPAQQRWRVLVDLRNYDCFYPLLKVSGGRGASIRVGYAESLFELDPKKPEFIHWTTQKGHRDEIEGKCFVGKHDVFVPDGQADRVFSTVWWRAGRYVEFVVDTADEPVRIHGLQRRSTCYPLETDYAWSSDEPRLDAVLPILDRGMRMSLHETYMDCPYFEQMMYTGDTRLEVLTTFVMSRDVRPTRNAVAQFGRSRLPNGFTQSRYPAWHTQVIPPFSLWWVAMVHDAAKWRGDRALVCEHLNAVRGVLDAYLSSVNSDGLVEAPDGWNFMDWVPGWAHGCPPGAQDGVNGLVNWLLVYTLLRAAELEDWCGEPEVAARWRRRVLALVPAIQGTFWDDTRGMYAEDVERKTFSEHAQCLALLSGGLRDPDVVARSVSGLVHAEGLDRCTIYFSFYLLEALAKHGESQRFFGRLEQWYGLPALGFATPPEQPEPSRSDCHAWGAHPLFHLYASVLGMRPSGFGMNALTISPMLGPLNKIVGHCAHPRGRVAFDLKRDGGTVSGKLSLPDGVRASVRVNGDVLDGAGEITIG